MYQTLHTCDVQLILYHYLHWLHQLLSTILRRTKNKELVTLCGVMSKNSPINRTTSTHRRYVCRHPRTTHTAVCLCFPSNWECPFSSEIRRNIWENKQLSKFDRQYSHYNCQCIVTYFTLVSYYVNRKVGNYNKIFYLRK